MRALFFSALCLVLLVVAGLGCTEEKRAPQPAPTPPSSAKHHAAPITVEVKGPPAAGTGDTIDLTVYVHRFTSDPFDLAIALPAGTTLVDGKTSERIDAIEPLTTRVLRIRTASSREDVVVTATIRASDHGARAVGAYRFGRPEPVLSTPPRPITGRAGGPARR